MTYFDPFLLSVLNRVKTVAIVGVSAKQVRPSFYVARYLKLKGYRVIPINPGLAGQNLFGELVYPDLASVPDNVDMVDMVDIFRNSEVVPEIVSEALARWPALDVIWMQIGVKHAEAAAIAEARGVTVIQDRCPKIEYQRLKGELRMGGFATGMISSRL
jgi:predicted CoA-binding protein